MCNKSLTAKIKELVDSSSEQELKDFIDSGCFDLKEISLESYEDRLKTKDFYFKDATSSDFLDFILAHEELQFRHVLAYLERYMCSNTLIGKDAYKLVVKIKDAQALCKTRIAYAINNDVIPSNRYFEAKEIIHLCMNRIAVRYPKQYSEYMHDLANNKIYYAYSGGRIPDVSHMYKSFSDGFRLPVTNVSSKQIDIDGDILPKWKDIEYLGHVVYSEYR